MSEKRRSFRGSYFSYVLAFFFFFFTLAAFSSVLSIYLAGIGKSPSELSLIVSAASFFSFAVVPLTGYLRDRTGNQRALCVSLLLVSGVCALAFSMTRSTWLLFLLDGAILSAIMAVMPISERMAGASRYRYGVLRIWGTLGYAAGAQAAGWAIQSLPSWALFAGIFAAALLSAAGFLLADEPEAQPQEAEPSRSARGDFRRLARNRNYLLFLVTVFVYGACNATNMTFAPLLLDGLGVPTSTVGTVISLSTLVEIPLILFSHKFMDRFSGKTLFAAACVIALLQYLIYWQVTSAPAVMLAMILLKAVASTTYSMLTLKMASNLVEPSLLSTGMALISTTGSLSSILLHQAGGAITEALGIQTFYLVMAGLTLLALLLLIPLRVSNDRKVFS